MATHPFFNAGAAPKKKAEHPLLSSAKRVAGTYRTALRNLQSGYLYEWDDELAAGVAAPVLAAYDYAKGDGFDVVKRYKEKQAAYDKIKKDDNAAHPIASTVGGVAGGLAQAVTAGAALKSAAAASPAVRAAASSLGRAADAHPLIAGAALGAADAGLAGAGYADPGSRAEGAAWNALFGTVLGGAGGAIGKYAAEAPYEPNRLNMFIGEKGATKAEKELLKEAQDMADRLAKQGQPQMAIRVLTQKKTGWFKDPVSDKWMMHIPDTDMKMTKEFQEGLESSNPVPMKWTKAYEHPGNGTPLAVRYPNLENVDVYPIGPGAGFTDMKPGYSADYNDDLMRMRIFGDPSEDLNAVVSNTKRLAAHETNHFVQGEEGFVPGASVAQFYMPDMTLKEATKVAEDMRTNPTKWKGESGRPYPPERVEELASWLDGAYRTKRWVWDQHANDQAKEFKRKYGRLPSITQRKEMSGQNTARDLYYSAGGEAMSRATEQNLLDNAKGRQDLIDNVLTRMDEPRPFSQQHIPPDILSSPYRYSEQVPSHPFFTPDMVEQPQPRKLNRYGDYVGGPKGVNTPQQEDAIVANWLRLANVPGAWEGRNFYGDFSTDIARRTGRDPRMAREYGMMMGNFSPLTDVSQNINMANTAMNQRMLGEPINVEGTVTAARASANTAEALTNGGMSKGPKAFPFGINLISQDFPQPDDPFQSVMDTWMGRISGIEKDGGLSPSNVRYLQENIEPRVRQALGGDHKTAQAQVWSGARIDAGEDPLDTIRNEMDRRSTLTQMEAIPGASTGSPLATGLNEAQKGQYTDEMYDAVGGSAAARMFGLADEPEAGFGRWGGHTNPNKTIRLSTGTDGSGETMRLNPSSQKAETLMRKTYQMLFGQEGSGSTTLRPLGAKETIENADAAYINMGQRLQGREMHDRLFKVLEEELGPNWNESVVPFQQREGIGIFKISDVPNSEFQGLVQRVGAKLGSVGIEPQARVSPEFTGVTWSKANTGDPKNPGYGTLLDEFNTPELEKLFDKMKPLFGEAQAAHERLAAKWGMTDRGVIDRFRNIASREGLKGIRRAIKDGILPVAALGYAAALMAGEGERSS